MHANEQHRKKQRYLQQIVLYFLTSQYLYGPHNFNMNASKSLIDFTLTSPLKNGVIYILQIEKLNKGVGKKKKTTLLKLQKGYELKWDHRSL